MSLSESSTAQQTIENEAEPYKPPEPAPTTAWLTRARAAQALGVSRTTLGAAVRQGKIVSRVEQGIRLFAVGAGAAKAILSAKEKAAEGRDEQAIVELFAAGVPIPTIITELRCSPRVLARTLKDLQTSLVLAREIYQQEREADEIERIREIETGHPDLPTTWAWCDFLFRGDPSTDPPRIYAYEDARKKFDAWIAAGNTIESASAHVRQAIESPEAWTVARRVWLAECQRAADRKAREEILEAHRIKMIVAKEESVERSKAAAGRSRTAALVEASGGKQKRKYCRRSNVGQIDERTTVEDDGSSNEENP